MCINIFCPFTPTFSMWSFTSGFPNKILYVFLVSPTHYTSSAHLMLLGLTKQVIFGEGYK